MKQTFIIGLILFSLIFLSACASSNTGHQIAVNGNAATQQQAGSGIERGQIPPDFTVTTTDGKIAIVQATAVTLQTVTVDPIAIP